MSIINFSLALASSARLGDLFATYTQESSIHGLKYISGSHFSPTMVEKAFWISSVALSWIAAGIMISLVIPKHVIFQIDSM